MVYFGGLVNESYSSIPSDKSLVSIAAAFQQKSSNTGLISRLVVAVIVYLFKNKSIQYTADPEKVYKELKSIKTSQDLNKLIKMPRLIQIKL